jgi:outer membrane protein TolC
MLKLNIFLVSLFILSVYNSFGQTEINRDVCRTLAVENSEQVLNAAAQMEQAGYQQKIQRTNYLPKISVSANYLMTNSQIEYRMEDLYFPTSDYNPATGELVPNVLISPETGLPVLDANGNPVFNQYAFIPGDTYSLDINNSYLAGVTAEQPLFMGGKIRAANELAELGSKHFKENWQLQKQEVIVNADYHYWNFVAVNEQLEVARKYLGLLEALLEKVSNSVNAGMVHRNELLKVQVKRNEAALKLQQAENALDLLRMSLCHIMGLPLNTELRLGESIIIVPEFIDNSLYSFSLSNRPDFKMLENKVMMDAVNEKMVRSDFLPQLGLSASYNYFGGMEYNDHSLTNDGFGIIASLKIPLWQWGEGRNKIKVAQLETRMAQTSFEKKSEKMELEIHKAKTNLTEAFSRYHITRLNLEQALENMNMSHDAYSTGMEHLTDYMEAQAQWQQSYAANIMAKADYKIQESLYQKATGELAAND